MLLYMYINVNNILTKYIVFVILQILVSHTEYMSV